MVGGGRCREFNCILDEIPSVFRFNESHLKNCQVLRMFCRQNDTQPSSKLFKGIVTGEVESNVHRLKNDTAGRCATTHTKY